jgi:Ni,Fe-hydrogenase III small subunit/Pyruvate/2-oxoacid:ferredoxin oxidoreductase delta subunit
MTLAKALRVRVSQGTQYITDLRKTVPNGFRGRPVIGAEPCTSNCSACHDACPTQAIRLDPLSLDLGRCVFCNACAEVCPEKKIAFTPEPKMGASERTHLVVHEGVNARIQAEASGAFSKIFGRSLKLRQVSAGGCNACELELNALANVNFDLQRYGIEWVASPRHADALVLTGPLTRSMKDAVRLAWDAVPDPRFIVAVGACTISGGLYDGAPGVDRGFLESVGPSLYVPGCPPHPLTVVNAILELLGVAR